MPYYIGELERETKIRELPHIQLTEGHFSIAALLIRIGCFGVGLLIVPSGLHGVLAPVVQGSALYFRVQAL